MSHPLHNSLVRILTADGVPIGVGFLAADNLILTCAHVIEQASGSDESVHFDLPLLAPGASFSGRVSFIDENQDVATIKATGLPLDATSARLVQTDELWGHSFRAFGVPQGHDGGVWASGVLRDQNAQGWLHIEDVKTTGFAVQPGFSGGPIWDENLNAVVGMVVAAERDPSVKAAFCIPVKKLSEAVPALKAEAIPPNPYRGLYAFREQDAPLFFGRETFSKRLLEAVSSRSLVAVVGASGAGKSSAVFAGLLPRLRPNVEWLIAAFRPGPRPFESLAATLLPLLEPTISETDRLLEMRKLSGALKSGELALGEIIQTIVKKHGDAQHLLLFADQFEELYTLCDDAETRRTFVNTLLAGLDERGLKLLLTLRADFMGQALSQRPFADALQDKVLNLGPMNAEELTRAITQPAEKSGARFEEGLPALIVADVTTQPGALPLLEFALSQLWEKQENGKLTLYTYQSIGGVEGALARYADQVYAELSAAEQEQARRIFIQLVAPGAGTEDTRRLTARTELKKEDWGLVRRMATKRLVVTDQSLEAGEMVEVVHEALIREWGRLRAWMNESRAFRAWQERLRTSLQQWQASGKDRDALLHGLALREAGDWLEKEEAALSEIEKEFIQKSTAVQKRRRRITLFSALAVVLVLLGTFLYSYFQVNAEKNRAIGNQTAAISKDYLEEKLDLALLLATQASRQNENFLTNDALLLAIQQDPNTLQIMRGHTDGVTSVAFSPDGARIVSASGDEPSASGMLLRGSQSARHSPDIRIG